MAHLGALVHFARHILITRQPATEVLIMARNGRTLLVSSMAPSLREHRARRTRPCVTVMGQFVSTSRCTRAWQVARGRPRPARNRREQNAGAALAVELFETGVPALRATALVTGLLTAVLAA